MKTSLVYTFLVSTAAVVNGSYLFNMPYGYASSIESGLVVFDKTGHMAYQNFTTDGEYIVALETNKRIVSSESGEAVLAHEGKDPVTTGRLEKPFFACDENPDYYTLYLGDKDGDSDCKPIGLVLTE